MKSVYTIAELAGLADVSWHRMKRLLDAYEVEYLSAGTHTRLVPLSEIRDKVKPLYDSFQMRERYQRVVASLSE